MTQAHNKDTTRTYCSYSTRALSHIISQSLLLNDSHTFHTHFSYEATTAFLPIHRFIITPATAPA